MGIGVSATESLFELTDSAWSMKKMHRIISNEYAEPCGKMPSSLVPKNIFQTIDGETENKVKKQKNVLAKIYRIYTSINVEE